MDGAPNEICFDPYISQKKENMGNQLGFDPQNEGGRFVKLFSKSGGPSDSETKKHQWSVKLYQTPRMKYNPYING